MMLANTLQKLVEEQNDLVLAHEQILDLFLDKPGKAFSIHSITEEGKKMGREPGDWYGVNSITQVIKNIFDNQTTSH